MENVEIIVGIIALLFVAFAVGLVLYRVRAIVDREPDSEVMAEQFIRTVIPVDVEDIVLIGVEKECLENS